MLMSLWIHFSTFSTIENLQKIVSEELHTLKENDFRYCYDQWKKRWNHCVISKGS
jgi:hypothetical protein